MSRDGAATPVRHVLLRRADTDAFPSPGVPMVFIDEPPTPAAERSIERLHLWAPPGAPITELPRLVRDLAGLRILSIGPGSVDPRVVTDLREGALPPGLEELSIHTGPAPIGWPDMPMPSLRRLFAEGPLRFDPRCFPALEALSITPDKSLQNLDAALTLPLTELNLLTVPSDTRLFERLSIAPLQRLGLLGGRAVTNLDGIGRLAGLRALRLKNLTALTSIAGLAELPLLQELDVQYCKKIDDIEALSGLPALRRLTLLGCGRIGLDRIADILPGLEHANTGGTG